ncbi:MAG: hypothetical protein IJQ80_02190 [Clostridia bacterium]|nr:hypothetical protein [Clostridia bacterium]
MAAKRKICALFLALVIVFAVASSLFIIIHEADHDCCGEDCPVCAVIEACVDTIIVISALAAAFALGSSSRCRVVSGMVLPKLFGSRNTPVTLKIKLLN